MSGKPRSPKSAEHLVVWRDEDYYCGWPFNGGMWRFDDGEIAVGFVRGRCDYSDPATLGHSVVDCQNGEHVILRSSDGGLTWPADSETLVYRRPEWDERVKAAPVAGGHGPGGTAYDPTSDGYCLISGFGIRLRMLFIPN